MPSISAFLSSLPVPLLATFAAALVAAVLLLLSSRKRSPEGEGVGDSMTLGDLRRFDGSEAGKPLLVAIQGEVFDVSPSRTLYGPGAPNSLFAGREAGRALALMSFDEDDLTADTEGLSKAELEVLHDWQCKFKEKYKKVGRIIPDKPTSEKQKH